MLLVDRCYPIPGLLRCCFRDYNMMILLLLSGMGMGVSERWIGAGLMVAFVLAGPAHPLSLSLGSRGGYRVHLLVNPGWLCASPGHTPPGVFNSGGCLHDTMRGLTQLDACLQFFPYRRDDLKKPANLCHHVSEEAVVSSTPDLPNLWPQPRTWPS